MKETKERCAKICTGILCKGCPDFELMDKYKKHFRIYKRTRGSLNRFVAQRLTWFGWIRFYCNCQGSKSWTWMFVPTWDTIRFCEQDINNYRLSKNWKLTGINIKYPTT